MLQKRKKAEKRVKIKAVFFDLGGVILRTEDRSPRSNLAESLGLSYEEIDRRVFENESSKKASLGFITEQEHWLNIAKSFNLSESDADRLKFEFFAGDRIDDDLLDLIRALRPERLVGVISNAWSGMRPWMDEHKIANVFDDMVISAEVGLAKPDPRIYQLAMQNLQVHPQESVFIDDMPRNVKAAREVGMKAILFEGPTQAIAELKSLLND